MTDFSDRIAALSPEKLSLLIQNLQPNKPEGESHRIIQRRKQNAATTLSFSQQRIWIIDQLEPGSYAHNLLTAVRFTGRLNVGALRRAIRELMRRHEVLRASFPSRNGQPVQIIMDVPREPLGLIDFQAVSEARQEGEALEIANEEVVRPFELAKGPMLRIILIRFAPDNHMLLFVLHHIISDGWSRGVLVREFTTLYHAFSKGEESPLPELPIQFGDYAAWQREWLRDGILARQLDYWKNQLEAAPVSLDLPTDYQRPARQTFAGRQLRFSVPADLTEALRALARRENATLFMVLLAGFNILLHRYSRQTDIIVGSPIANRNRPETEGLIGFFANTLALRTDFTGDPSFVEILARTRKIALDAYANQDLPFEKLVEELRQERSLDRPPIFQVMFGLDNTPLETLQLGELRVDFLDFEARISPFDISLAVAERLSVLTGGFEYNEKLFEAGTIAQMVESYLTLLRAVCDDPRQRVSRLPLTHPVTGSVASLPTSRRREKVEKGNLLHRLFEEQVRRTPDSVALVGGDCCISYSELDRLASRVASRLLEFGLPAESRIGVFLTRSPEMVAGLLGSLKAGAAYVPLDPSHPAERLRHIVQDAGVKVVLTDRERAASAPGWDCQMLLMDEHIKSISAPAPSYAPARVAQDSLAYIMYTSGTTGEPKGVQITHRNVVSYVEAALTEYDLGPADRVLQFAALSFDTSVEEIFPCLICGGTLALRSDSMISTIRGFLRACRQMALTVISLPTAYWHQMMAQMTADSMPLPPSLRLLIIGGERAQPRHWQSWRKLHGTAVEIKNTYGPTEATVVAAAHSISKDPPGEAEHLRKEVPIGRSIANSEIWALDQNFVRTPIGVPGETYIGGDGVARGYLDKYDLTAERFRPDPFGFRPGARIYRTGDLSRVRSDGNLEYMGRVDRQVKIRGFRIELGEVETALLAAPNVSQAAVTVRDDNDSDGRLMAYVVPSDPEHKIDVAELRDHLRTKLPHYMLPSSVISLRSLPLTHAGKINYAELLGLDPRAFESQSGHSGTEPRTVTEAKLASIWKDALHIDRVGIEENFFEIGGHSLLAVQVMSQITKVFGVEIPLRHIFEFPSIAALSAALTQMGAEALDDGRDSDRRQYRSAESLLEDLDQMSDAEVDALIRELV